MMEYVPDNLDQMPEEAEQEEKLYYVSFEIPAIIGVELHASSKEEAEALAKSKITTDSFKNNLLDYHTFDSKIVETEEV